MFRGLVRLVLVALVVVAAAFFLFGYWSSGRFPSALEYKTPQIDTTAARDVGAAIGEKTAVAASRVSESLEEGSLTAKIKAKMALDDVVKARAIDVTTEGTAVTLSGTVHSQAEHARAIALARETNGVSKVVDQLTVR
jgi:hyperosmotically inducible protein